MKRILYMAGFLLLATLVLMALLELGGCEITRDWSFTSEIPDLGIDTPEDAVKWVAANIEYEPDGIWNNWKTPKRTYAEGFGDCEDFTALWMYLVETQTEYTDTYLIGGKGATDETLRHAYGWWNGIYYEPQTGEWFDDYSWAFIDFLKYDYDRVMWLCIVKGLTQ